MNKISSIAGFYKFMPLENLPLLRSDLLGKAKRLNIWGTILIAQEGINATIAGSQGDLDTFLGWLSEDLAFGPLRVMRTESSEVPFHRMKVKIKNEIVTMGMSDIDVVKHTGKHVSPKEWNQLIQQSDVVLLDTRNAYEVSMGTFEGAEDPRTDNFRQWPDYVNQRLSGNKKQKVAMFCTGGIRCEKASAYLKQQGFEQVFQLEGGILNYMQQMDENQSLWQGDCFVFDDRVALDHHLEPSHYELCRGCRHPISDEDKHHPDFEEGVSCPRCHGSLSEQQKQGFRERQRQMDLAEKGGYRHIGDGSQPRVRRSGQE